MHNINMNSMTIVVGRFVPKNHIYYIYTYVESKRRINMLKDNLVILRKLNGCSQEKVAEKIGISRQAYGKWESGETTPDIEKCTLLADFYGITLDSLIKEPSQCKTEMPPAPAGKHIFGTVSVNERGQIVIPKEAREIFKLIPGSKLVVLGDENEGLALVHAEVFEERMQFIIESAFKQI